MKYFWTMILAVALAGTVSAAPKKTKAAAKEPAKPALETKLNASLALTDGNSETLAENVSLVMEGEKEGLGSVLASIENNYGESQVEGVKDTTVNNVAAALNLKKTLSPRTFASVDGSALHDQVASISYRALVGPGLGFYFDKSDKRELSLEAGPSYLWEKVDGVRDDYLTLRVTQRYSCQITPTAKLIESVEYIAATEDFNRYLLAAEVGVEAAMTERISLRVVVQDKYNSDPAEGKEYNDVSLLAGIGLSL